MLGAMLSAMPLTSAGAEFDARSNKQWMRLQRGLSREAMAGCRKAAARLLPRLGTLLEGPQWESQIYPAIVNELKLAGVYPKGPPPVDPKCTDAGALRGEAEGASGGTGSTAAGIAAAAAALTAFPVVGSVTGAVLVLIAAVVMLAAHLRAQLRRQAGAKEAEGEKEETEKIKKLQNRMVAEMEPRDDCALFGRKLG